MKKFFIIILFILFQFNIFSKNVSIKGKVLENNNFISGVTIFFIDKTDKIFETKSNKNGEYFISIPENIYSINIKKDFYKISENNLKSYSLKKNINIDINLNKSSSFLDGFVVDEKEKPVKNAKLLIKNGENSSIIFSNDEGKFSTYLKPGIFTILVSKYGYSSAASIKEIKKNSEINNLKIKLKSSEFFLQGTVTDGIRALSNIEISLNNKFFKKIATTISDKNGLFYFYSIPLEENFFILINNKKYKFYRTNSFKFNKKNKNKVIFLEKK